MVKYCKNCLMPDTRPRVIFINNICNGCITANSKKKLIEKKRKGIFKPNIKI